MYGQQTNIINVSCKCADLLNSYKNTNKSFNLKLFLVEKTVFCESIDISPKKEDTDKQCRINLTNRRNERVKKRSCSKKH